MKVKTAILVIVTTLALTSAKAQTSSEELMSKGVWQDPSTGLQWSRCLIGQNWTGTSCSGDASQPKFHFKMSPETPNRVLGIDVDRNAVGIVQALDAFDFAGFKDWRLPTISELQSLLACQDGQVIPEGASVTEAFRCPKRFLPQLNPRVFQIGTRQPLAFSSITKDLERGCRNNDCYSLRWVTAFIGSNGKVDWKGSSPMLAVRGSSPPDAWLAITATARGLVARDEEIAAARRAEADAEARLLAQRRQAEALAQARQMESEERAFVSLLSKKADPQSLYLRAGKFERENDLDKAKRIYEFLTENFTRTNWAIKANDRLLQLSKAGNEPTRQSSGAGDQCGRYYTGYAGQVDYVIRGGTRNIWGERLDKYVYGKFVVLGAGNGNVSVMSSSGGTFLKAGEPEEFSCTKLQELENLREIPR